MSYRKIPRELDWIPELPNSFEIRRLDNIANQVRNPNHGLRNSNLLTLSYGAIKRKDIDTSEGLLPASFESYNVIRKDDIVLRLMDLQNDKQSLRTGLVPETGIITSAYVTIRPKSIVPQFLAYYLQALDHAKVFYSLGSGLRQSLNYGDLKLLPILVPPLDEQRRIADYLDHETAEIDALIGEAEHLALLRRERLRSCAAVWTRAGSPHHDWPKTILGRLISVNEGQVDPRAKSFSSMPLVAPNHVESYTGRIIGVETAADQGAESGKYLVRRGQVIFSKIRPALMKSSLAPFDCLISADMYAITPHSRFLSEAYLLEYFLSPEFEHYANVASARVAMPKLNRETLHAAPISLPPRDYQEQAVQAIGLERKATLESLREIESLVALAKERRAALISAAVTGQIDVTEKRTPVAEEFESTLAEA